MFCPTGAGGRAHDRQFVGAPERCRHGPSQVVGVADVDYVRGAGRTPIDGIENVTEGTSAGSKKMVLCQGCPFTQ